MSLLSAIGVAISVVKGVVTGISGSKDDPGSGLGRLNDTLTEIAKLVVVAEAIGAGLADYGSLTGEQKLKGITGAVAQIILQADFMKGNKIEDDALFLSGVESVAGGIADILNSVKKDGTKTLNP